MWIPSHIGVKGNEIADEIAKEAATQSSNSAGKNHYRDLILLLAEHSKNKMNEALTRHPKYFSKAKNFSRRAWFIHSGLDRIRVTLINRVMSGHTKARSHLHRMNIVQEQTCQYYNSNSIETLEHLVWRCPKFNRYRERLLGAAVLNNSNRIRDVSEVFMTSSKHIILRIASYMIRNQLNI